MSPRQLLDYSELNSWDSDDSLFSEYAYGAVKLVWGDENLGFVQRWNPFNYSTVPFIVFTSHHILYNEKEKESSIYNCDEFIASLEYGNLIKK